MLKQILAKKELNKDDLKFLLNLKKQEDMKSLFNAAYKVKLKKVGNKVYFRGLIEFSNICQKDCYYCGIRKSNANVVKRFMMQEQEIIDAALWAYKNGYGSIVLQSGESSQSSFIDFIEKILKKIKRETSDELGITLCLGEQTKEVYQKWFKAGAHRYLLRIETSNKELYKKLHPADHDFEKRKQCLNFLKQIGYQVGTGVMIGIPGQTIEDLANDLIFFKEQDIDMLGMGPYLVHKNTPLAKTVKQDAMLSQLDLGLKMIAVARLFLKDINIASTTALQALDEQGREKGLLAGANVIMPNITPQKYREFYQLYENKPCLDEDGEACRGCLETRIKSIGAAIGYRERGDSRHYFSRKLKMENCRDDQLGRL